MAVVDRAMRFRSAVEVLAEDAVTLANKLKTRINQGEWKAAEDIAANLQRTARDAKWLVQRQPKSEEGS